MKRRDRGGWKRLSDEEGAGRTSPLTKGKEEERGTRNSYVLSAREIIYKNTSPMFFSFAMNQTAGFLTWNLSACSLTINTAPELPNNILSRRCIENRYRSMFTFRTTVRLRPRRIFRKTNVGYRGYRGQVFEKGPGTRSAPLARRSVTSHPAVEWRR